jgi:hypothetical protein
MDIPNLFEQVLQNKQVNRISDSFSKFYPNFDMVYLKMAKNNTIKYILSKY